MEKRLAHIGVAVRDLDKARRLYERFFEQGDVVTESVPDQKVRVAFFRAGAVSVELTEPTSPDSPISQFIEKRGEGVHHLSFAVDDIVQELVRLKEDGFQLIDEVPRRGAGGYLIAFIHPKSTNGVLIELSQKIPPSKGDR